MQIVPMLLILATTVVGAPRFEDFAVHEESVAEPKVDITSHPIGRKFRSVIRETVAEEGVNFAGHFTVVEWGCGSPCQQFAIVNTLTGEITHNPARILSRGLEFRRDSRLIVLNPFVPGENDWLPTLATRYYLWDGRQIKLLAVVSNEP